MCCLLLLFSDDELDVGVPPFCCGVGEPLELSWGGCDDGVTTAPPEGGGGRGGGTVVPGGGAVVPAGPMSSECSLQTVTGAGCVGGISMLFRTLPYQKLLAADAGTHRSGI